ncbi:MULTISPECIES: EboA domain-containing protein [Streptomyces]|uniref:EboA domain-containing protein n=2 Tax=Streptomyces violaceoruber group TaxID=2867121 RepID=A0ACD4WRB7_STRVN|nr:MULTISPECIES: EboA domain-containing protein [Streptomyces]MDX3349691.1 EboA domain-containing protein [Streptomyces sp. ME02-6979A]MDX3369000.1 EboA domain-containing protein [Streptomyces sp. ME02-6987-2C]MDX3426528.1 EboA domain-containing protein [Streptomyces sp. ME02-6985-2c]WOY99971.1 EboA domain-containing protein [Streptomyces violaceoruber]WTC09435.1 EboA domain-containing protein [Streptomyces anthocyanicus]
MNPGGDGPRSLPDALAGALDRALAPDAAAWLEQACAAVRCEPGEVEGTFAVAARRCGRGALDAGAGADAGTGLGAGWSVDDAARVLLLAALPVRGAALAAVVSRLYRVGGGPERRAVLRSLSLLEAAGDLGDLGLPLVEDALRCNDPRLIAAAVGPYGALRLGAHAFRQAVLKCVFVGVPLDLVAALDARADAELDRMMADFAAERRAAGRALPPDVAAYLHTHRVSTEATA